MDSIEFIKRTFVGNCMTNDEIEAALNHNNFKIVPFKSGETIHKEGDHCLYLEILLSGTIDCIYIDQFGDSILIKAFTDNEIVAGNTMFGSTPVYSVWFLSRTKGTMLKIHRNFLFELFLKSPVILRKYLTIISDRALLLDQKLKPGKKKTLRQLILEYLEKQCSYQNSNIITLPISKKDLSDRLGVQRTSLSREFSRMENDGLFIINRDNHTIEMSITLSTKNR